MEACFLTDGPRVALFTDAFFETNGVATLCREYVEYTRRANVPFFVAYGGTSTRLSASGSLHELQLRRGPSSFPMDAGLYCDPFLTRHIRQTTEALRAFRPDLIHISGPGDVSILGLLAARQLGVPSMASWHTNLHEYAQRRAQKNLALLPACFRDPISRLTQSASLWALMSFYKIPQFVAAPNPAMVDALSQATLHPSFLMAHGVNTALFTPARRLPNAAPFTIGYVGRLTPEKNVRALADLERRLLEAGQTRFRFLIVGEGSESRWLQSHLQTAEFTGVLRGEALADAFAAMDAFVFPSLTDTFGLVVLEAMSSGVPIVATVDAGRRAGVTHGVNGLLSSDFTASVTRLILEPGLRGNLGRAGRSHASTHNWDSVFADLRHIYAQGLQHPEVVRRMPARLCQRAETALSPPPANGVSH